MYAIIENYFQSLKKCMDKILKIIRKFGLLGRIRMATDTPILILYALYQYPIQTRI